MMQGPVLFQQSLDEATLKFDEKLSQDVAGLIAKHRLHLGVIETLTAGSVASQIATLAWPYFRFGLVCPDPKSAIQWTGIPPKVLSEKGLGSIDTAKELATNCAKRSPCDAYLVVTGVWETMKAKQKADSRGIVNLVFMLKSQQLCKTFHLEGNPAFFAEKATQSALLYIKACLEKAAIRGE